MEIQIFTSLLLAICYFSGADAAVFTVKNNCPFTIWPATLTGTGSRALTGFELAPQGSRAVNIPAPWSGRIWARFQCSNSGRFSCRSGDCNSGQIECNGAGAAPPATLVEFTLAGDQGKDFYDVSLVDGFNLPVSVVPVGGNCPSTSCPVDINNQGCPDELKVRGDNNAVVGCKSACLAFNQPQYCCTGAYGTPATCRPTNYSQIFKSRCPQAYSYAYDDGTSTFTCPTGKNYLVTFWADSAVLTVKNNCAFTIWPAALTVSGSPVLTGFELAPQVSRAVSVGAPWSGKFWARFQCSNSGQFRCASGDCNSGKIECNGAGATPPATLVEFALGGEEGNDFYDVSLVDGFNLPLSVTPVRGNCPATSCPLNINNGCPHELAVSGQNGAVVGCKSACLAFNQPLYCCTGAYSTPAKCRPTSYSQMFKLRCPQACSYAYDDETSTFTCPTGEDYIITFCP